MNNTPSPQHSDDKKAFVSPALNELGAIQDVTRGPNQMRDEDAIIFATGGEPAADPS